MIIGIGVDIVENKRFKEWPERTDLQLEHIFSAQELSFTKNVNLDKKIEFYASRFAAKEAFFKAFSSALVQMNIHKKTSTTFDFLFSCQHVFILPGVFDVPEVIVNVPEFEKKLNLFIPAFQTNLTISHEKDYSIAVAVISV